MSIENIPPATIRRIASEISELTQNPPEDIKLIPNEDDITDIQAILSGPVGTPYEGGNFKVKLKLGPDFPQTPPRGVFLTKIFHPNVSKNGEICVNTLKKDWKEDLGIKHLLLTVKCLLIYPNPESALNEEAGRLLLERYEDYAKQAKLMTMIHAAPKNQVKTSEISETSQAKNSKKPPAVIYDASISSTVSTSTSSSATHTSTAKPTLPSPKKRINSSSGKDSTALKVIDKKKKSLKRL